MVVNLWVVTCEGSTSGIYTNECGPEKGYTYREWWTSVEKQQHFSATKHQKISPEHYQKKKMTLDIVFDTKPVAQW